MPEIIAGSDADLDLFCALPGISELNPELVRRHAPDAIVLARRGDGLAARASLWWSAVPDYPGERPGFIGHFAARDGDGATQVLDTACRALAGQGCTLAVGPIDGSTWRRYRLLSERGPDPPFFLEPDNPDDFPGHFQAAGFSAFAHYYSSVNDDLTRARDRSALAARLAHAGYGVRCLEVAAVDAELAKLWRVASTAFRDNLFYVPIGEAEFRTLYEPLLSRVDPGFVLLAEHAGEPVGFCLAVPDLLQAARGGRVDTVIVKSIAVLAPHRGKGIAAVFLWRINTAARAMGMRRSIHALMHEENASRLLDRELMRDFRRYTLYARQL